MRSYRFLVNVRKVLLKQACCQNDARRRQRMNHKEMRELEDKCRALRGSRDAWRLVGGVYIALSVIMLIAVLAMDIKGTDFVEILDIKEFNLPNDLAAVGLRLKELESGRESWRNFLIETKENQILKKGGKYVLFHELHSEHGLAQMGVQRKLLKAYELK